MLQPHMTPQDQLHKIYIIKKMMQLLNNTSNGIEDQGQASGKIPAKR